MKGGPWTKIFEAFYPSHPITDTANGCFERHEIQIIKNFAEKYVIMRLNSYSETKTLEYLGKDATLRQRLAKLILFHNV